MRSRPTPVLAAAFALCAWLGAGVEPAQAADAAVARTEAFIAAFKKVKSGAKLTAADKKANDKIFLELDRFMDFATLTSKPIEPRAAKFSAKQKAQFTTDFRDLIRRIAYPDSGEFFRDAKMKIGASAEKGGVTVVPIDAKLVKQDLNTTLELHWAKSMPGGELKLVDVAFDGDSLIKDYQNQFARIIDKEGVAGLMKKVDEKKAELARGGKATATEK